MNTPAKLLLIFSLMISNFCFGAHKTEKGSYTEIPLQDIYIDSSGNQSIYDILKIPFTSFNRTQIEISDMEQSYHSYWARVILFNDNPSFNDFLLEVARPATNKIQLFEIENNRVINSYISGDSFEYKERDFPHRKNLFTLNMPFNQTKEFLVNIYCDKEVIGLPLKLWDSYSFSQQNSSEQYFLGIYYGIFFIIILLFLLFYAVLKEITYLYYVFYVVCLALVQLTIDGFIFQYVLGSYPKFADSGLVLAISLSTVFIILYADSIIKTRDLSPIYKYLFNAIIITSLVLAIGSVISVDFYHSAFPFIKTLSFLATLIILVVTIVATNRGKHINIYFSIAFVALITGVAVFLLGNMNIIEGSFYTENAMKFGSIGEVLLLTFSMVIRYRDLVKEKEHAQRETLEKLEEINKITDEINIKLENQVKERTKKIQIQKEELQEKNTEILSSIKYALRIQNAILPPDEYIGKILPESFVYYSPKDIVSGDFYWFSKLKMNTNKQHVIYAAVDCTGHGVPGALMSILANNHLENITQFKNIKNPADLLNEMNLAINDSLNKQGENAIRDGMDMSVCMIDKDSNTLQFAGANNPLYLIRENEIIIIKGDKKAIGGSLNEDEGQPFTNHEIDIQEGDMIYTFTDGYADQFGGPKGKKFKYSQLRSLILSMKDEPIATQKEILGNTIQSWQGELEQVDDICIIGVKI